MSIEESLDLTGIYSVADHLPAGTPLIRHRPFRAPHHTLAHRGVLFLDEFPEFGTRVLEVMKTRDETDQINHRLLRDFE